MEVPARSDSPLTVTDIANAIAERAAESQRTVRSALPLFAPGIGLIRVVDISLVGVSAHVDGRGDGYGLNLRAINGVGGHFDANRQWPALRRPVRLPGGGLAIRRRRGVVTEINVGKLVR